jgi:Recombinase
MKWSGDVVRRVLRSRTLVGQHEHNGKLVTDQDGLPIQRAEPVLSVEEFDRVQEALQARTVRAGDRNRNPLAGVLFCYFCDAPAYLQKMTGRKYSYYRCSARKPMCRAGAVKEDGPAVNPTTPKAAEVLASRQGLRPRGTAIDPTQGLGGKPGKGQPKWTDLFSNA